ncbi:hypothetical protein Anapl_03673 [Anas platyrhynchos]|uniref:Uncharacterized protein n=1 Tax=Anas platyrhynchos TaxID=8839 RepID=R0K8E0_ANAPL|nr:hypothetical protein Anapl_03673 [Anas platyrhynchos]
MEDGTNSELEPEEFLELVYGKLPCYNYYNIIIPDLMDSWTNLIYQERVSTTFVELPHQSEFFEDIETTEPGKFQPNKAAAKLDLMATGEELDAWLLDLSEQEK